ncbi:MAG: prolyl oligopeptidase family serine peptidase [Phycisphaerae bacterium]|jgi:hypothetical protein|nr:prolyl oligopeptidase family serine peptidase [Phycisphaerae bacterium]
MLHEKIIVGVATILLGSSWAFGAEPEKHLQIARHPNTGKLIVIQMPVVDGKPVRVDVTKARSSNLKVYEVGRGRPIPRKESPKTATRPAKGGRTGFFRTKFEQRSPQSNLDGMLRRLGWKKGKQHIDYKLKDFTFEVYVPPNYSGAKPYGLMVYISPGPRAYFFGMMRPHSLYAKHSLIHIAAYNSGNKQNVWVRLGLAIDAVGNMKKQYNIDPDRVYATGISGGGRCSSMLGLSFADTFDGAIPIVGCYFFTMIKSLENPKKGWGARFIRPVSAVYSKARLKNRFVLLTGQHDFNREETESTYVNGFKKFKFKHATYLEVPGMGHTCPPARYFEQALIALDAPLKGGGGSKIVPAVEASKAMREAQRLIKASKHGAAYAKLTRLATRFPSTASAAKAKRMLAEIKRTHPRIAAACQYDADQLIVRSSIVRARRDIAEGNTARGRDSLARVVLTYPDHTESKEALTLLETVWSKRTKP